METICPRPSIPLAHFGRVDTGVVEPLLATPEWRMLSRRSQLGLGRLVFPGATTTRDEHSLFVMGLAQERARRWLACGRIDRQEVNDLTIYALLHDIGHGPYSHVLDPLCGDADHNRRGADAVGRLKAVIEQCGGRSDLISRLFTDKHHWMSQAVRGKPWGPDALAYLWLDANRLGSFAPPEIGSFLHVVELRCKGDDKVLAVQAGANESLIHLMEAYVHQYRQGYFNPVVRAAERYLQKLVSYALQAGEMTFNEVANWSDEQLNTALLTSALEEVREGVRRILFDDPALLPRVAVTLRPDRYVESEQFEQPDCFVYPVGSEALLCRRVRDPQRLLQVEHLVAELLDVSTTEVVVVPSSTPDRFVLPDLKVVNSRGRLDDFYRLNPGLRERQQEVAEGFLRVDVCLTPRCQARITFSQAERVAQLVAQQI